MEVNEMIDRILTKNEMADAFGGHDFSIVKMMAVCQKQRQITKEYFLSQGRKEVVEAVNKMPIRTSEPINVKPNFYLRETNWQAFKKSIESPSSNAGGIKEAKHE